MTLQPAANDGLLTPAEVAAILFVDPKTVTRWARAGKLEAIRTPGGHRRYQRSDVLAIMAGQHQSQSGARPSTSQTGSPLQGESRTELDDGARVDASAAEETAAALEAAADEALRAVVAMTAQVAEATEKAAVAVSRARAARAAVGSPRAAVGSTEGSGRIATTARPSARPFVVPTQRDKDQHPVSD
jgi:excisionase family DNA binding protein